MSDPGLADAGLDVFATPAELAEKTGGVIPVDHPDALRELKAATAKIRGVAGWHIAAERIETVRLTSTGSGLILIPTLYLVELISITNAGVTVDPLSLDYGSDGRIYGGSWSRRLGDVVATIRHGFEEVPDDLRSVCLQMATRSLVSPLGAVREQTLTTSVTWSQAGFNIAGGNVLLEVERADIAPYRIVSI